MYLFSLVWNYFGWFMECILEKIYIFTGKRCKFGCQMISLYIFSLSKWHQGSLNHSMMILLHSYVENKSSWLNIESNFSQWKLVSRSVAFVAVKWHILFYLLLDRRWLFHLSFCYSILRFCRIIYFLVSRDNVHCIAL